MSSEIDPTRRIASPLARRVGDDASAAEIAHAVGAIWDEVDEVLSPILGAQGVVALYQRSVRLACAEHPWLAANLDGAQTAADPATLKAVLARHDSAQAAAAGSAFLRQFHNLLVSLVGTSLTSRLLRCVWKDPSNDPTAQDNLP